VAGLQHFGAVTELFTFCPAPSSISPGYPFNMLNSLSLWDVLIIVLAVGWPATLVVAALIIGLAFVWTNRPIWRIIWIIVALSLCYPVFWRFASN
jgi:hypothetical protein